jgi:hypothetical protein
LERVKFYVTLATRVVTVLAGQGGVIIGIISILN